MTASSATSTDSERLESARKLPNGARFYRCALQINPFDYLQRYSKPTEFRSEHEYNQAIIQACRKAGIEVVAVTDHYRVNTSEALVHAFREAGLFAFSGFEAVAKDGVHFLCLFDPSQDVNLERIIGFCGVHDPSDPSPLGSLNSRDLLGKAREWGAVIIAAHVTSDGGLLPTLSGQTRIATWKSPDLLACALPGDAKDAPQNFRKILENKDSQHMRPHPLAIVNASDVNGPEDLRRDGTSCFIKMSEVSVEALRQAFLDPESRIRLNSDPLPETHTEFLAMTWEGGFMDNALIHLNGNLNTLIGGRGTGKSTVIESIRYALGLDPLGDEARKTHQDVVKHVLRPGTKLSLLVRSHHPSERYYVIERTVPNPPSVKDETGSLLPIPPKDTIPGVQVFGQHEVSELAKSPEKLTFLLDRFVERDPSFFGRKTELRMALERSRRRIVEKRRELEELKENLATLPSLEENQKRFQEAGLEDRLKERSLLVREETLFMILQDRLEPFQTLHNELVETLPIDAAFLSRNALNGLPNASTLGKIGNVLPTLSTRLEAVGRQLGEVLSEADAAIAEIHEIWDKQRESMEANYECMLRNLQKSSIDGAEFIRLRRQIERLKPLKEQMKRVEIHLRTFESDRQSLVAEWEDIKAREYLDLDKAAGRISRKLRNRVRVKVTMAGSRKPLDDLLRTVGGNLATDLERLRSIKPFSLPEFSQACQKGKTALMSVYNLPPGAAERIADAGSDLHMKIEELDLPATTSIELNTASDAQPVVWKTLGKLSTGQKATAVLLLLLLDSKAPLVVDQPEDDLDNRFISEVIVPIMRQEKGRRQFVFATHNANIPVLGDAELILGLAASGEAEGGKASIASKQMGSIDSQSVRELVEETLEGGKDAFEMRRFKYGF